MSQQCEYSPPKGGCTGQLKMSQMIYYQDARQCQRSGHITWIDFSAGLGNASDNIPIDKFALCCCVTRQKAYAVPPSPSKSTIACHCRIHNSSASLGACRLFFSLFDDGDGAVHQNTSDITILCSFHLSYWL